MRSSKSPNAPSVASSSALASAALSAFGSRNALLRREKPTNCLLAKSSVTDHGSYQHGGVPPLPPPPSLTTSLSSTSSSSPSRRLLVVLVERGGIEMSDPERHFRNHGRSRGSNSSVEGDGATFRSVASLARRRKARVVLAATVTLAALAGGIAVYVELFRPLSYAVTEEYAVLADEYSIVSSSSILSSPYNSEGGSPRLTALWGSSLSSPSLSIIDSRRHLKRAKDAVRVHDAVRRYRDEFLERSKLLDTETEPSNGSNVGADDGDGHKTTVDGTETNHSRNDRRIHADVGCEATVFLLRHCEKDNIREHCSYLGYERSVYLSTLFGHSPEERWPAPSNVYALNPGERRDRHTKNEREVETVRPLAQKFNLTVIQTYGLYEVTNFSKHLFEMLRSGEMCGKVVVISWKHADMPRLAQHLGCGPFEGCPMDYPSNTFDDIWQIKYVYMIPWNKERKEQGPKHHRDQEFYRKRPEWKVFGTVQKEFFDPLAFSKRRGDYPIEGTTMGGRWMPDNVRKDEVAVEEAVLGRSFLRLDEVQKLNNSNTRK